MRLRCEYIPIDIWHSWFAWYPVVVELSGRKYTWVWLETVERSVRMTAYDSYRSYRFPAL